VVNVNDEAGSDTAVQDGGIININTAGIEALDTLPGIGPSTAQKIIEYRDNNGPFTAKEDIMNVSGIGEAKFAQIEEFITVEGE
jgi:competence protein ComEA